MSETSLTGLTLAEIKSAIDGHKRTRGIVNKLFEGSSPKDITTNFSNIDWYIKDQEKLGARNLLVSFPFNKKEGRMMTNSEIGANYLDIYTGIFRLKEKISHDQVSIKNIVYTVDNGTMDWIRETNTTLFIGNRGEIYGIYRLTLISVHQFNIIANGETYSGGTATIIIGDHGKNFNIVAVDSSIIRSPLTWCLELVDSFFQITPTPPNTRGPLNNGNNLKH